MVLLVQNQMNGDSRIMAKWTMTAWRLWINRSGQDMVEYALVAGFVAVAAGAIFPTGLMPTVSGIYSKLQIYLSQAGSQGS
jgi:pilus assembly protein Flp/PilA